MQTKTILCGILLVCFFLFLVGVSIVLAMIWPWLVVRVKDIDNLSYDCVVSAYKENLDWLKDGKTLKGNPNIIVYSKHQDAKDQWPTSTLLPNHGRCDHSYLYHIVNNYDNLADITLFTTASAFSLFHKKQVLDYIILPRLNNSRSYRCLGFTSWTSPPFQLDSYLPSTKENREKGNEKIVHANVRPFGAWWDHYLHDIPFPKYIVAMGMFATTRDSIRKIPLETWKELLIQHEVGDNVEVGHFLERSWYQLLTQ